MSEREKMRDRWRERERVSEREKMRDRWREREKSALVNSMQYAAKL